MARSRMEVWADDPGAAVRWAGGLICDRAMAGWDVIVRLPAPSDCAALKVLGAGVRGHDGQAVPPEWAMPLVTMGGACGDPNCEHEFRSYLCAPAVPDRLPLPFAYNSFRYRLSVGARAFKAHALRASGLPVKVATTELFWPAMPLPFSVVRGRIDRWPNAGRCNDASNTPETCC